MPKLAFQPFFFSYLLYAIFDNILDLEKSRLMLEKYENYIKPRTGQYFRISAMKNHFEQQLGGSSDYITIGILHIINKYEESLLNE